MESNLTAPQTTAISPLGAVIAIDAKLSRGEAMDLLMEDLLTELKAAHAQAEREVQAANHALATELTLADIEPLLARGKIKLVCNEWDARDQKYTPYITVTMAMPAGNAKMEALLQRQKDAVTKRGVISDRVHKMETSKTAFRNTVLRSMLANTPQGQAALDALASVKLAIKSKLLDGAPVADEEG